MGNVSLHRGICGGSWGYFVGWVCFLPGYIVMRRRGVDSVKTCGLVLWVYVGEFRELIMNTQKYRYTEGGLSRREYKVCSIICQHNQ